MKTLSNRKIYLVFLILLAFFFIAGCEDDPTEPEVELEIDQNLVGTWELTKITKPIVTTPALAGIALTAVFNQDATLQFTTIDFSDTTTTIDPGTWSASEGVLTITLEDEDPKSSPYTVSDSLATIDEYSVLFNGTVIVAGLEFTRQN